MPGRGCPKGGRRHTPIVSRAQARLFGAVAGGVRTKATGLSVAEAKRHLRAMPPMKKLPERVGRKRRGGKRKGGLYHYLKKRRGVC